MNAVVEFFITANKIALLAFVVVVGFLIYEVRTLIREQRKKQKPVIPKFSPGAQHIPVIEKSPGIIQTSEQRESLVVAMHKKNERHSRLVVYVGIVVALVTIGITGSVGYFLWKINSDTKKGVGPTPIIQEVSSPGLRVFDAQWREYGKDPGVQVSDGKRILIGIQTIEEADIDRARIRVNEKEWNITHITTLYNPEKKVYYKEYIVATGSVQLRIDAQLHSYSDGWLGE